VRKEISHGTRYDERDLHEPLPASYMQEDMEMKPPADTYQAAMRVVLETDIDEEAAEFEAATEFIRITDDH